MMPPSRPIKIVVCGPVGAGKSTFIRTLSEIPVISTEEISLEGLDKATTTVALDFGSVTWEGQPIYLFGTPGQERFHFMWEILSQGADGLILLVSGAAPGQFLKARHVLEFITSRIPVPFIIGVTRQDTPRAWQAEEAACFFAVPPHQAIGLDARGEEACRQLLLQLLNCLSTPYPGQPVSGSHLPLSLLENNQPKTPGEITCH